VLLASLLGTAVTAMSLCDYFYPGLDTNISNLETNFSLGYHKDPDSSQGVSFGELKVDYSRFFDSINFGGDISAVGDMALSAFNPSSFSMITGGNIKYFFSSKKPFFGFAGIDGMVSSSYQRIGLEIKAGLGYGRFTDVTPLAKTMRIIDYLMEQEVFSESPSDAVMTSIAYEIANIPLTYRNSIIELVRVIQEMIGRAGLIKNGKIQEADIQKITDIIEDKTSVRYCGGDIKIGLGYEISDPFGESNDILLTASLNYAFTTTPRIQFLTRISISSPWNILQNRRVEFALDYDHLLSEKLKLSSSYSFSQQISEDIFSNVHCLSLNFVWALAEKVNLTLGMRFGYEHQWNIDIGLFIGADLL